MTRIVVDTNVLISRALSPHGPPAAVFQAIMARRIEFIVCDQILAEYREILLPSHVAKKTRQSEHDVDELIAILRDCGRWIDDVQLGRQISADPDDDIFLEAAVAGEADYIVSGDRHLLDLGSHEGIPIVTPAQFVAMLASLE